MQQDGIKTRPVIYPVYKSIAILIVCMSLKGYAQNLVPNPSFEYLTACPSKLLRNDELNKFCPPWLSPTWGSPDVLNICNSDSFTSVPNNTTEVGPFGGKFCKGFQQPHSGNGYLRMFINLKYKGIIEENFQIKLLKNLELNKKYSAGFYINMANCSGNAISDFGMYLSQDSIRNYTNINLDPPPYNFPDFVPQIVNKKGILKDTVNWIEISDVYKAKGDENWITVGCFKKIITYDSIANSNGAQYYFDDVFVYEIESIVAEDTICLGDSTPLIANSKSAFYWSNNYLGTDTISLDSIFWVKPTATAQYFLIAQTFTDSLTLHVVTPQVIPLPADTFKCSNEGIILDAGNGNAAYYWSTGQKEQTLTVNNPGLYSVLVYNTVGCKSTASVTVADFPYAVPELGNDTVVCFEEVQPLLTAINAKRYYWEPFGETSASIIVNSPGTYNLQITDSNNCKFTDTITIDNYCNYPAWFPNAFSPGTNDTLNRIFRPVIYNLIEYNLQVFTRWGEKIFETNDYSEGWDGYYKGQPLEAGQYMYLATYAQVIDGKKTWNSKNGIVYLVR